MSSLFARLKSATAHQHRTIEAAVDPMHTFASLDSYKAYLARTWVFHVTVEAELAVLDWSDLGIDMVSRRKTSWLEQDLRILGVPRPASPEPLRARAPAADLSFALGCLYVLEGATLGGQIISRHLAALGIGPGNGGRFFNGYGARTGEMWQSFRLQATAYCVTDDQVEAAVAGARWTFGQFRDLMERGTAISHAS